MSTVRTDLGYVRGPQGETGPQGEKGATGNAATVNVGTVTTSSYGTQAQVTNSGTAAEAVLDFVIPQGAPGETVTDASELTVNSITSSASQYPTYTVGEKMKAVLGKISKFLNDLKTAVADHTTTLGTHTTDIAQNTADITDIKSNFSQLNSKTNKLDSIIGHSQAPLNKTYNIARTDFIKGYTCPVTGILTVQFNASAVGLAYIAINRGLRPSLYASKSTKYGGQSFSSMVHYGDTLTASADTFTDASGISAYITPLFDNNSVYD